ncbi:putative iron-sulfur cluster assembly associated protein Nar1 [Hortaea werneckii]|nr:putative iron-sulfur cluster assembly associated protein Nar1 [Hortaea werneckii]
MSAILSADDLNDFISPGVACIKPVETLPQQQPEETKESNPYEVTTEEKVNSGTTAPPAQINLTDCLACSGCVTSAEAVLVSLQSHGEVLDTLDKHAELKAVDHDGGNAEGKIFVASISPQSRASLAATYNVTEREAGYMISQLLSGPYGLRTGGKHGSGFTWVIDTNVMREVALTAAAEEAQQALEMQQTEQKKRPVLTSACPGWICYAEKTHPHILPHLSQLKSPQALTGTLVKSVLSKKLGVSPDKIWHLAVMPCFDKKLEAARGELTNEAWNGGQNATGEPVRDVDCVITARELLMLAESRNISFPCLPRTPLSKTHAPAFPDSRINKFLFGRRRGQRRKPTEEIDATIGTSGGYLYHVLKSQQARHPGSSLSTQRGRNADVSEYTITSPEGQSLFQAARYYGFRNIQNLVRRLKPARPSRMPGAARKPVGGARKPNGGAAGGNEGDYAYVEVMACPGGCTNGGGQIKVGDVATLRQIGGTGVENGSAEQEVLPAQREWLSKVDEAYWSAESEDLESIDEDGDVDVDMGDGVPATNGHHSDGISEEGDIVDGIDHGQVRSLIKHWADITSIDTDKLLGTTYRAVESDVGKSKDENSMEKVSALAVAAGGGW